MTAPKPPLAVRLARLALPSSSFEACPNHDYARHTTPSGALDCSWMFNINSLNDIALAEKRVVEAGFGTELTARILAWTEWPEDHQPTREGELLAAFTAPAPQRAAALDALFTAFPDLYERLTGSQ